MANRKAVIPALSDWSAADATLARMCRLDADRRAVEARMTRDVEAIRSRLQPEIVRLSAEFAESAACVEQFCVLRREDFAASKSLDLRHGVVSFRLSPPAVKPLNRKRPMKAIVEAVMVSFRRFIRVKQELDRERILADYAAGKVSDEDLANVGLKVAQDETFGIELETEEATDA